MKKYMYVVSIVFLLPYCLQSAEHGVSGSSTDMKKYVQLDPTIEKEIAQFEVFFTELDQCVPEVEESPEKKVLKEQKDSNHTLLKLQALSIIACLIHEKYSQDWKEVVDGKIICFHNTPKTILIDMYKQFINNSCTCRKIEITFDTNTFNAAFVLDSAPGIKWYEGTDYTELQKHSLTQILCNKEIIEKFKQQSKEYERKHAEMENKFMDDMFAKIVKRFRANDLYLNMPKDFPF